MAIVNAEALEGGSPIKVHLSDRMDFSLESVKNSLSNCRYEIFPRRAIRAPTLLNSPLLNSMLIPVWFPVKKPSTIFNTRKAIDSGIKDKVASLKRRKIPARSYILFYKEYF